MRNNNYYKRQVALHFNIAANHYNEHAKLPKITGEKLIEIILAAELKPKMILDIGAGTGYCTEIMSAYFPTAKFINIDIAEKMLQTSKKTSKNITLVNSDFDQLPFVNNNFDLIYSNMALQWSLDLHSTLQELSRALKDNGLLAFAILGNGTLKELQTSWLQVDSTQHVNNFYTEEQIIKFLKTNNFTLTQIDKAQLQFFYPDIFTLLQAIKKIGGNYVSHRKPTGLKKFDFIKLANAYEQFRNAEKQLVATYEVKYFLATKRRNL